MLTQHTLDTPYPVGPVHCYSAELCGELVLFDTGPPTQRAIASLQREIDLKRLQRVVCTHCHIDHYGLASWLEENTDATIYLPYRDALKVQQHARRLADAESMLRDFGFDNDYLAELRMVMDDGTIFPAFPKTYRIVEETDWRAELGFEVLPCPGHSQSDLVYAGEGWAITGDVLLDGIFQSPLLDIDLETGERFSNYHAYCESLHNLARLRTRRIFPGHRGTIPGVDATILAYLEKLIERTLRMLPDLGGGGVAETTRRLFGGMAVHPFHLFLKASELVFMQDFVREPKLLRSALQATGLLLPVKGLFEQLDQQRLEFVR